MADPAAELHGVVKRFARVVANDQASFDVRQGEIHALVGENGAGKSTLMRILYGMMSPDAGRIRVEGRDVRFRSPRDALAAGLLSILGLQFSLSGCSHGSGDNEAGQFGGDMHVVSCSLGCTNGNGGEQVFCSIINTFQNQEISVSFSEPIDLFSVNSSSFRVVNVANGTSTNTVCQPAIAPFHKPGRSSARRSRPPDDFDARITRSSSTHSARA